MASFKILGINHIAIAPKDCGTTKKFLKDVLKFEFFGDELVKDQGVNTSMFASQNQGSNPEQTRLEILDAEGFADSPIANFLAKRGGGIHHIALTVDNIENALKSLHEKKVKMIDAIPRKGAHNTKIAFIHPHATGGVLIELVEQL